MESVIRVNRQGLCDSLRPLMRAGGRGYPVFSHSNGELRIQTSRGRAALPASGEWEAPVRVLRIRELAKAVHTLMALPDDIEEVVVRRQGRALLIGGLAVSCTTRNVEVDMP